MDHEAFSQATKSVKHPNNRLAIVTQDPANYGGVLRLVEYIYRRAESVGLEPVILHYGKYSDHPELHSSFANLLRGEINFRPKEKQYNFRGMRARAIGAWLPEWEPQRIRSNALWRNALLEYDSFMLIAGSAHAGLALAENGKKFLAWVSSTVEEDRRARLAHTPSAFLERLGLPSILRAERHVHETASRLLAVSRDTEQHLTKITDRHVEVWPFPVDTVKFSPAPAADSNTFPRFLFVGRAHDPRKRIGLFLASCETLRKEHPELGFTASIVSSKIAAPDDLHFPIEWLSDASEAELIEHYRSSTALVLTSEQEGLGIAAMEAMACGTPVISTRCGGPETFIEDGVSGFFVEDDPKTIARRMFELATDVSAHARMGGAAHTRIEDEFSERVWNEKFEKLLRGV